MCRSCPQTSIRLLGVQYFRRAMSRYFDDMIPSDGQTSVLRQCAAPAQQLQSRAEQTIDRTRSELGLAGCTLVCSGGPRSNCAIVQTSHGVAEARGKLRDSYYKLRVLSRSLWVHLASTSPAVRLHEAELRAFGEREVKQRNINRCKRERHLVEFSRQAPLHR